MRKRGHPINETMALADSESALSLHLTRPPAAGTPHGRDISPIRPCRRIMQIFVGIARCYGRRRYISCLLGRDLKKASLGCSALAAISSMCFFCRSSRPVFSFYTHSTSRRMRLCRFSPLHTTIFAASPSKSLPNRNRGKHKAHRHNSRGADHRYCCAEVQNDRRVLRRWVASALYRWQSDPAASSPFPGASILFLAVFAYCFSWTLPSCSAIHTKAHNGPPH